MIRNSIIKKKRTKRFGTLDEAMTAATGLDKIQRQTFRENTNEIMKNTSLSREEKVKKLIAIGALPVGSK